MPTAQTTRLAERLRRMADEMQAVIDERLRPLDQNWTPKRGLQLAQRTHEGHDLQLVQRALRALAARHEAGSVPLILQKLKTKKELFELLRTRADVSGGHYSYRETGEGWDTGPVATELRRIIAEAQTEAQAAADAQERKRREREQRINALRSSNTPGFFPTPPAVIARILKLAEIDPEHVVLEPSAGIGSLAAACPNPAYVKCVELRHQFAELIEASPHLPVAICDFLELEPEPCYDRVVMNPPFEDGQDMAHVRHAFEFLKPGGRLVAVMPAAAERGRNSRKGIEFREWVDALGGVFEKLPDGSFNTPDAVRPTDVSCVLLVIDKE